MQFLFSSIVERTLLTDSVPSTGDITGISVSNSSRHPLRSISFVLFLQHPARAQCSKVSFSNCMRQSQSKLSLIVIRVHIDCKIISTMTRPGLLQNSPCTADPHHKYRRMSHRKHNRMIQNYHRQQGTSQMDNRDFHNTLHSTLPRIRQL